jgi:hypothetical protein
MRDKIVTHKVRFSYFYFFSSVLLCWFFCSTLFTIFVMLFHQKSSSWFSFFTNFHNFKFNLTVFFTNKPDQTNFVHIHENHPIFIAFWIHGPCPQRATASSQQRHSFALLLQKIPRIVFFHFGCSQQNSNSCCSGYDLAYQEDIKYASLSYLSN